MDISTSQPGRYRRLIGRRSARHLDRAAGMIAVALLVAVAWPKSTPLPSEQQVRQVIERILARPEYQPPPETFIQRALEFVGRILLRIVSWLLKPLEWLVDRISRATPEMSPSARWLVVGVLSFLLLLLLLHIFYLLAGSFESRRRVRRTGDVSEATQDPLSLVEQAKKIAAAGDYREAVRLLYVAALLRLDRAGLLSYDPSRTNWEYVEALRTNPIAAPFREFTRIADRAMYSSTPVKADDFAQAERLFGKIEVVGA